MRKITNVETHVLPSKTCAVFVTSRPLVKRNEDPGYEGETCVENVKRNLKVLNVCGV